jgi:hypothetical protein
MSDLRLVVDVFAIVPLLTLSGLVTAQGYPARAITMYTSEPGSAQDLEARMVG